LFINKKLSRSLSLALSDASNKEDSNPVIISNAEKHNHGFLNSTFGNQTYPPEALLKLVGRAEHCFASFPCLQSPVSVLNGPINPQRCAQKRTIPIISRTILLANNSAPDNTCCTIENQAFFGVLLLNRQDFLKSHQISCKPVCMIDVADIEPKLYELLLDAFDQAEEGEQRICPISEHCLWRNFQTVRRRAVLGRWKDAFKVMRKNCETDWAQRYPQYAVSAWIGHGIEVSAKHYLQVPEELYDKVAATKETQTATKPLVECRAAKRKS